MNIAVRLFVSSMCFAVVIALAYGLTTADITGVIFLGMMALALIMVAGYIVVAEREAHLASDQQESKPTDLAGEEIGTFTLESYWPIVAAIGSATFLCGIVFLPGISIVAFLIGLAIIAWTARLFVRESV